MNVRCACGAVRGALDHPESGNRIVCYCRDCRAFARWLGAPGLLDAFEGSDILQVAPADLTLSAGADQLRAIRPSETGMTRWYTACCRTPVANQTTEPGRPFAGLLTAFIAPDDRAALPAVRGYIQALDTTPPEAPRTGAWGVPAVIFGSVRLVAGGWWRGAGAPCPFVDARGAWVSPPVVLTPSERAALG